MRIKNFFFSITCFSLLMSSGLHGQCGSCDPACCNFPIAADFEYLYWQMGDSPEVIDLVKSGTSACPNQKVILGGKGIRNRSRSGGRFTLGYQSVEASYFFIPSEWKRHSVSSSGLPGSPYLTIPFYDVTLPGENYVDLATSNNSYPFSGRATLETANHMQGAELNWFRDGSRWCAIDFTWLAGFRYWNFSDQLRFFTSRRDLYDQGYVKTKDTFHTRNHFYGGQIGFGIDYRYFNATCCFVGKVALGAMDSTVTIKGRLKTTEFDPCGEAERLKEGLFALHSNSGTHGRTSFSVIPECIFKLRFDFYECFRFSIGYTFIYVTDVLWAEKTLNRKINPDESSAIVYGITPHKDDAGPKAHLSTDSLWVQGLTLGMSYRY